MPIPLILMPILAKLAESGLGLIAGAITAKGKEFVEGKLGVDLEKSMQTEEGKIKLMQMQHDREEMLLSLSVKQQELSLEEQRIEAQNTNNARDMNARVQESANASDIAKNAPYYLDFIIVGSVVALGLALFYFELPLSNKELAYTVFGALMTLAASVINFHRGSSASSKSKDDTIGQLSKDRL